MTKHLLRRLCAALVVPAMAASLLLGAGSSGHAAAPGPDGWTGTWATALTKTEGIVPGFTEQSIRMIVRTSIGGHQLRIRLSNVHGDRPLTIGQATVARPARPSTPDLDPRSVTSLTFRGARSVTIPKGAEVFSDPVPMAVAPLSQLAVTLYFPHGTGWPSFHLFSQQTAYIYDGNHAAQASGAGHVDTSTSFWFLSGVEVRNPVAGGAVAVLGASISDGVGTTLDANRRWPDQLAERIVLSPVAGQRGVLNVALAGNAIGHDGDEVGLPLIGTSGLNRLPEHVYTHRSVRTVIVDLGLNDQFLHNDPADVMIAGLRRIAAALHQRGYRVLFTTLTPAGAAAEWTPQHEATRQAVNAYIRTTRDADGVVDADRAIRDPGDPTLVRPDLASPDGVHPNDRGNRAIAHAVPLHLL